MANYKVTDSELTGIADVIRLKGGTSDPLVFPSGFASAINAIETQGTYISKTITSNGEYDPASDNADAFSHVTVSVPTGGSHVLVSKTISENGTYNPTDDNADAYSQVVVNVSGGGNDNLKIAIGESAGAFIDSTITVIGNAGLYSRNNITELSCDQVVEVGRYGLYNCTQLSKIDLPLCSIIYGSAFQNCTTLKDVSLPECTRIYESAFASCYGSLSSVALPKCETISGYAFSGCQVLNTVSLPKCTSIYGYAFTNCKALVSLYLMGSSVPTLQGTNAFTNTPLSRSDYTGSFGSIFVPESLVTEYKTANNWSAFSNRIVGVS